MSSRGAPGTLFLWGIIIFSVIQGYTGKDTVVIITAYNGPIYKINATDGTSTIIYNDVRGVENVAYDPVLEHIYWSNLETDRIQRINLNGEDKTRIVNVNQCQGMVIDPVSRLLFYTDDTSKKVNKMELKSKRSITIARISGSNRPHDITADVSKQKIYWTVLGESPQIETSDYNGGKRKTLLRAGLVPTALALGSTGGILFWCDEHHDHNELMALNLANRRTSTVHYGAEGNLYDLDILNTTLYLIDRTNVSVYLSVPETGGTPVVSATPPGMSQYRHLKVFAYPYDCPAGKYGVECEQLCGHCLGGQFCTRKDGLCPEGCQPGWTTGKCLQECEGGTYGDGCVFTCGHCNDDNPCSKIDGQCPGGCAAGWSGDKCDKECQDGYFGVDCSGQCGQCNNGQMCDKGDGQCIAGCRPGWTGTTCHDECPDGSYGLNCSSVCGQCVNQTACNRTDGHCSLGCESGWKGQMCRQTEEGEFNIVPVVSSVCTIAVVVVIAIVLGVVFYLRGRHSPNPRPRTQDTTIVYSAMGNMTDPYAMSQPASNKTDHSVPQNLDMAHELTFKKEDDTDVLIKI